MPTSSRPHNPVFDALRGLAAVMVMLFHLTNIERRPIVPGGYLAVDFFFLLSGFVLWNAYGERLRGGLSAGGFVALRLKRLYPLFAIGLALGLVRALGAIHLGDPRAPTLSALLVEAIASGLLLPSALDTQSVFPFDNPAWSLSLEVFVNIAFCVWFARASRQRMAQVCVAAAIVLAVVARHYGSLDTGWRMESYAGGVARCAFGFTLGVVMARQHMVIRLPAYARPWLAALLVLLFGALLTVDVGHDLRLRFDIVCILCVFPLILALAAGATMHGRSARAATAMGNMSYPLYATHYPLILPLTVACSWLHIGGGLEIVVIAGLCIAVAFVAMSVDRVVRTAWSKPPLSGRTPALLAS